MELKRILARDTRTATEQAIRLYGEDVLIVSNHRVGQQTELVVAVDIPAEAAMAAQPAAEAGHGFARHFAQASAPAPAAAPAVQDTAADDRDRVRSQELVALVREELADLRREFRLGQRTAALQLQMQWDDSVMPVVERLRECAMPGGLRTLLLEGLQGLSDRQQAVETVRAQLLAAAGSPQAGMPTRGVHVLAGPAGCGKTTLAARLARWGVEEFGADQVALVSFRDHRAGAWSQVQMLGAQAGAEVFRATDAETLSLLLSEIGHRALLVIDTPGVQIEEQVQAVLSLRPQAQVHAVLAADSSEATCRRVLSAASLSQAALMVCKLDEADAPWALLQFLSNCTAPPARSLLSRSDRLTHPLQTWQVSDLVDHALRVTGLSAEPPEASTHHIPAMPTGLSVRDLNG